ncbi:RT0821/Lpp0805 family surface protein [Rhizobium sp. S152]|uniref:RT0821/Lpp0805 family surface protein n=1 Tax=Rhizobium sp. S152 TaxID=3055038 RepID=UPI0025A9B304|nr:RT0821/Lpp0805 family surface protein [Rhizobium sp. S152]MDM9628442.1 RT0821/Lpp0805 family surface protein [Rhizobium sp. S152]
MLRVSPGLSVAVLILLTACSTTEPLVTASTTQPKAPSQTDQAVIAETVGRSDATMQPLAWANPSTGSAGVIQRIAPVSGGGQGCREFISTHQTISGSSSLNGIACPADENHWKISR